MPSGPRGHGVVHPLHTLRLPIRRGDHDDPQADLAEGDRLLTWIYRYHKFQEASRKWATAKKEKDSKAPATEDGEDEVGE